MTEAKGENLTNVREEAERERRRRRYKFALVRWLDFGNAEYAVEYKKTLSHSWYRNHEVICDDQPERVLKAMLRMMKEDK